ncbi:hypothetical protein BDV18DRAFT_118949 [Aspergillus unguis]
MPFDEKGVKWSCEPCIRGHRSSKCAHFDRLMVSVGKAGRPLSKCPHVEGSCNCKKLGAFMVAIPKDSGCLCRPVYKMLLDENAPTPAASRLPIDLTTTPSASAGSASLSPNKIQKPSRKQVKTAPEQVTRALHSIPEYHQHAYQYGPPPIMGPYPAHAQMTGYPYNATNGTYPHPNAFPMANSFPNGLGISSSAMATPSNGYAIGTFHPNVYHSPMQPVTPMPVQTQSSCCSNSQHESSTGVETDSSTVYQSSTPTIAPMSAQKQGPCCSSSRKSSNGVESEADKIVSNDHSVSSVTGSPMASSSSSTWQEFSSINEHLSPVNGTSNGLPLVLSAFDPQIPPKHVDTTNVGSEKVPLSQADLVTVSNAIQPSLTAHTSGVPHSCSCGPKCNCFACPDHPYNDVTVRHVQEMGRIITQESQTSGHESNQSTPRVNSLHANEPQPNHPPAEPNNHTENSFVPMPTGGCCDTDHSPLDDQNDAQVLDTHTADHLMLPDAYYTYEYEFGLPGACAGEAGNCQCGPSCSCLGCLTHGNF